MQPPFPRLHRASVSLAVGAVSAETEASTRQPGAATRALAPSAASDSQLLSTKSFEVDTGLHPLSPELLDALRKVVPRRRHPKLPYIVAVGLLAVLGTLAADPSARESLGARLRPKQAEQSRRVGPVETVTPPVVTPPVLGADGVIAKPIENLPSPVLAPATPSAPPVARPKKKVTRPHPAPRP